MMMLLLALLQAGPDEAACAAFAKKLEAAIVSDDGATADAMMDRNALVDRTFKGTPDGGAQQEGFRKGIVGSFNLGVSIAKVVKEQGGTYTFLRLRAEGGARRALFRMVLGDTFNYHDYLLEAGPGGALRATDVHVMLSGEWMSETFRRMYLGMLASEPGVLGKLTGKDNEFVKSLGRIQRMTQLRQQGKAAEALQVYATLSEEAKKDKMALLTRYQAAMEAAPESLPEILDQFEAAHPKDACLPAISIGAHVEAKRWGKALAAVDVVDASVGGDPYLDVQRASIHLQAKDLAKAKAAAAQAMEREKGMADAYWTMVTISLEEMAYADTVKWLDAVEKDLKIEIGDLETVDLYAGFVKSPEHRAWKAKRK